MEFLLKGLFLKGFRGYYMKCTVILVLVQILEENIKKWKISSDLWCYAISPNIWWMNSFWFWTDFSLWRVCPFLLMCISSIPAIIRLAVRKDFNLIYRVNNSYNINSTNCIWQLKNAINGSIYYECKKNQNTQVGHKNLHI